MSLGGVVCARCKQGVVVDQRVKATGELIQVCEECEAVWPEPEKVVFGTARTLQDYMADPGLSDRWLSELEDAVELKGADLTTLWDTGRAKNGLDRLVAKIRAEQPGLRDHAWIRGNDRYPLRSTISLNVSGPPWDDDVVLWAEVKADEPVLAFACDISDGGGQVLVDGPQLATSSQVVDEQILWAYECLDQYVRFLAENLQVILDELDRKVRGRLSPRLRRPGTGSWLEGGRLRHRTRRSHGPG